MAGERDPAHDVVDLLERLRLDTGSDGPVWSLSSFDLNVNLIRFDRGRGVPSHVNDEVDVLLVGVEGDGIVTVDGVDRRLSGGQICLVPKGAWRRRGLWPS